MSEKRDTQKNLTASDCISSLAVEERIALARKAGEQLAPELRNKDKYLAAQRVAEALVSDLCLEVRETLAFELRKYKKLPKSIAVKIACDVDEIAVPFLRVTPALSDALMAELIPLLSDNAHLALAVRSDLGIKACRQLICHANDNAALTVICNPSVAIDTSLASLLLDHFGNNRRVIEAVVGRPNLALSVVTHILQQVSDDFQRQLCDTYGIEAQISKSAAINSQHETIWRRIRHAAPGQIHAHVIDLRQAGKLTPDLMLGMADRGCLAFLESTLAVLSSRTLTDVRETLHLANPKQFRALMQDCDLDVTQAQAVQKLARRHYGAARGRREVGNPALWHSRPATRIAPRSAA